MKVLTACLICGRVRQEATRIDLDDMVTNS